MSTVTAKLEEELQVAQAKADELNTRFAVVNATIRANILQAEDLESMANEQARKVEYLRELILIESGFPPDVIRIRNKLIRAEKNSKREDITVAKKKALEAEAKDTLEVLQSICYHTLVLSYDGYGGDSINEYSNARYGVRKCAICKLTESSESTIKDMYKVLDKKESRLIKRDIRNNIDADNEKIIHERSQWYPIDLFVEAFRRSAGDINVRWPVIHDGNITKRSDCFYPGY